MATSNLRLLGSLLLATATLGLAACGSSVQGGGDDGDGDDECDQTIAVDCLDREAACVDGEWVCETPECDQGIAVDCLDGEASCVDGEWVCPESPECPDTMPSAGAACDGELACSFPDQSMCGEGSVTFRCEGGAWSDGAYERCSPPYEECPATEPTSGTACAEPGQVCEYQSQMDCGPSSFTYTCEDGVWSEPDTSVPRCAMPSCRDLGDAGSCAEFGCRWLEPGCGDNPLEAAGCFDQGPCGEAGCLYDDEICTEVSIDPCAGEACDACGAQESLCIPQIGND